MAATALPGMPADGQAAGGDILTLWAEATGRRRAAGYGLGVLRFAFYGRVSTEDWHDPVDVTGAAAGPGGRPGSPSRAGRSHPRSSCGLPRGLAGAADDLRSPWLRVHRWRLGGVPYRAAQRESAPGGSCPTRCADTRAVTCVCPVGGPAIGNAAYQNVWPAEATSRQDYEVSQAQRLPPRQGGTSGVTTGRAF